MAFTLAMNKACEVRNCLINLDPDAELMSGRTASDPVEYFLFFFLACVAPPGLCSVSHVFVKKGKKKKERAKARGTL